VRAKLAAAGLLLAIMFALGALPLGDPSGVHERSVLAGGFILLFGYYVGTLVGRLGVPQLTGYLLAGIVAGPYVLGLYDLEVVRRLRIFDELALCLIAFTAGGELRIEALRARARTIVWLVPIVVAVAFGAVAAGLWLAYPWVAGYAEGAAGHKMSVVLVLALIAVTTSPACTVAVIVESRARGGLTDVMLGAVVLADIAAILLFPFVLDAASGGGGVGGVSTVFVLLESVGSLVIGAGFGRLAIWYLRNIGAEYTLFVMVLAILITSTSRALHLHALMVAIAAGFVVENFSAEGVRFIRGLERLSLPTYLIFFSITGAALELDAFFTIWPVALALAGLRAAAILLSTQVAGTITREGGAYRRWVWTAFVAQAGVSLGFAALFERALPEVGVLVRNLIVGTVIVSTLAGPVLLKIGLERTGQAGAAQA